MEQVNSSQLMLRTFNFKKKLQNIWFNWLSSTPLRAISNSNQSIGGRKTNQCFNYTVTFKTPESDGITFFYQPEVHLPVGVVLTQIKFLKLKTIQFSFTLFSFFII